LLLKGIVAIHRRQLYGTKDYKNMYKFFPVIAAMLFIASASFAGTRAYDTSIKSMADYLKNSDFIGIVIKVGGPVTFTEFKNLMSFQNELTNKEIKQTVRIKVGY
jgi:hypothetical protein